jgi:hypothetical protein
MKINSHPFILTAFDPAGKHAIIEHGFIGKV